MLKHLWIMRHGLAEAKFESDFSRPLSEFGKTQATSTAKQILNDNILPIDMLVSPFARTLSTAESVNKILKLENPLSVDEMLVHYADHKLLAEYLKSCHYESLIIISHMPIVAYLCQYLCQDLKMGGFSTGQAARIDFDGKMNAILTKTYHP